MFIIGNQKPQQAQQKIPFDTVLSFAGLQLKTMEQVESMATRIEQAPCVETLILCGNSIGVDEGKRLAKALERHGELKKLIFCDMFTGRLRSEIPETIKSMLSAVTKSGAQIQALNVADNAFGPIGAESISEFLLSPACNTLQILDLNNTGLGEGAMIISKCLLEMKENAKREGRVFCLKTFKCDRNRLYSAGGSALSKAVKGLGTLEHFSMMGCTIQWQGIVDIAQSLTFNPHLKRINISDNLPGSKGSRQIAEALKPLKELEDVVLEDLLLRNAAVDVVKALCDGQHRNLKKLNLCGNQIKFDAGRAIIEIWKRNGDMPLLWLGLNAFGEDGFEEFAQMTEDYPNIDLGDPDEDEYVSGEEDDDESDTEDDDAN